jgi:hypothetical protein
MPWDDLSNSRRLGLQSLGALFGAASLSQHSRSYPRRLGKPEQHSCVNDVVVREPGIPAHIGLPTVEAGAVIFA